jgi:negative regulator of sigma E activity
LGRPSQLSVESHPVKRRLGGWCEMVASLGVVSCQLLAELSSVGTAVKIRPEGVKLNNSHS